jgi:hypothetical protein
VSWSVASLDGGVLLNVMVSAITYVRVRGLRFCHVQKRRSMAESGEKSKRGLIWKEEGMNIGAVRMIILSQGTFYVLDDVNSKRVLGSAGKQHQSLR